MDEDTCPMFNLHCYKRTLKNYPKTYLNHFILDGIIWIRIWSSASAIHAVVVLIVVIVRIEVVLVRSKFAHGRHSIAIAISLELEVTAIAPEVTFRIKFDEFVSIVAGVRTGETNPGSRRGILYEEPTNIISYTQIIHARTQAYLPKNFHSHWPDLFIGSARDTCVESLPLDVTFVPCAVFRVAVTQDGASVLFQRL